MKTNMKTNTKFFSYILLSSVLSFGMCFASNDLSCVDVVTSRALEQIQLNKLILDDNCKNQLHGNQNSVTDDNGNNINPLDDNSNLIHGAIDDKGNHINGTDDKGNHINGTDDNGNHINGTDDNGVHREHHNNGSDDNGVHSDDTTTCRLILSGSDGLCNKVRSEHSDLCGFMTDDDCFNIVKDISSNLIESIKKNSGDKTLLSIWLPTGLLVASQLLFAVL